MGRNHSEKISVTSRSDVMRQGIWFNQCVNVNTSIKTMRTLSQRGIYKVSHVWKGTRPDWEEMKKIGWREEEYLDWRAILSALPNEWRMKLRGLESQDTTDDNK